MERDRGGNSEDRQPWESFSDFLQRYAEDNGISINEALTEVFIPAWNSGISEAVEREYTAYARDPDKWKEEQRELFEWNQALRELLGNNGDPSE